MKKDLAEVLRELADLKEQGALNDLDDSFVEACLVSLLTIFSAKVTWESAKKITNLSDSALASRLSRMGVVPEKVRRIPIERLLEIRNTIRDKKK